MSTTLRVTEKGIVDEIKATFDEVQELRRVLLDLVVMAERNVQWVRFDHPTTKGQWDATLREARKLLEEVK